MSTFSIYTGPQWLAASVRTVAREGPFRYDIKVRMVPVPGTLDWRVLVEGAEARVRRIVDHACKLLAPAIRARMTVEPYDQPEEPPCPTSCPTSATA